MSIIIIAPILLLLWYIIWTVLSCCSIHKNEVTSNDILNKRHKNMQRRLSIQNDEPNMNKDTHTLINSNNIQRQDNIQQTNESEIKSMQSESVSTKVKNIFSLNNNKQYQQIDNEKFADVTLDIDQMSITESNTFSTHNHTMTNTNDIEIGEIKNKLKAIEETKSEHSRSIQSSGYDGTYTSIHCLTETTTKILSIHDDNKTTENKMDDINVTDINFSFSKTTDMLSDDEDGDITINDEYNIDHLRLIEKETKNIIEVRDDKVQSEQDESDNDGSDIVLDPSIIISKEPENSNINIIITKHSPTNEDTSGSDQDIDNDNDDKLEEIFDEVLSTANIETQSDGIENNNNMSHLTLTQGSNDSDNKITDGINFDTKTLQLSRNISASIFSVMSESTNEIGAAKSFGYNNQTEIGLNGKNEYKYEMIHHSQENNSNINKKKQIKLNAATPKDIQ
eukprot:432691_1